MGIEIRPLPTASCVPHQLPVTQSLLSRQSPSPTVQLYAALSIGMAKIVHSSQHLAVHPAPPHYISAPSSCPLPAQEETGTGQLVWIKLWPCTADAGLEPYTASQALRITSQPVASPTGHVPRVILLARIRDTHPLHHRQLCSRHSPLCCRVLSPPMLSLLLCLGYSTVCQGA